MLESPKQTTHVTPKDPEPLVVHGTARENHSVYYAPSAATLRGQSYAGSVWADHLHQVQLVEPGCDTRKCPPPQSTRAVQLNVELSL